MTDIKPFPPALAIAYRLEEKQFSGAGRRVYNAARDGQAPDFMVISCCDSRVLPTDIFGAGAGDIFMHRNIANFVPPCCQSRRVKVVAARMAISAALEYGVRALKVAHVLVLGHTQCGGAQGCHDMRGRSKRAGICPAAGGCLA